MPSQSKSKHQNILLNNSANPIDVTGVTGVTGVLHLMPVPLHLEAAVTFSQTHGADALAVLHRTTYFVAEHARTARRMLATLGLNTAIADLHITEIPRDPKPADWHALLAPACAGNDLVLLSEAGCPAIADPGALLVRAAYSLGLTVVPHVGPSSLLLALMASGMNGQSFAFVGYVPQDANARKVRLLALEARSKTDAQTQLMIETPYRNHALLDAVLTTCQPTTLLGIALDLTCANAYNQTHTIAQWRAQRSQLPDVVKRQMVLTLLAY